MDTVRPSMQYGFGVFGPAPLQRQGPLDSMSDANTLAGGKPGLGLIDTTAVRARIEADGFAVVDACAPRQHIRRPSGRSTFRPAPLLLHGS